MFLCFCQLALAPLLGPYPQAYTASQLRSLRRAPGRLDHRPVHIVGYWAPVTQKWAGVATQPKQKTAERRRFAPPAPAQRTLHHASRCSSSSVVRSKRDASWPNAVAPTCCVRVLMASDIKEHIAPAIQAYWHYNHGHKAEDADRWGTRKLGDRPGNGAPLRARVASFFLPCERGLNSHTDVVTRPRLSLAL